MLRNCCSGSRRQGVFDGFWTKQAWNNFRKMSQAISTQDEWNRKRWDSENPSRGILIIGGWKILTEWARKGGKPKEMHFEGLISLGKTGLEVGVEEEKWVIGYLKMSHQDDGQFWCHPETNGKKEGGTRHRAWSENSVAPETRQVQSGEDRRWGLWNWKVHLSKEGASKGALTTWHQQSLQFGNVLSVLSDLPFLQEKPEIHISYVKSLQLFNVGN